MEREREFPLGACAWSVLGAAVVAYELLCPNEQLMSAAADRAMQRHPVLNLAVKAGAVALAAHVGNFYEDFGIDPKWDVVHRLGAFKHE